MNKSQLFDLIRRGDFKELFVNELAWYRYRGNAQLLPIDVDDVEYNITIIAERNGFQILYSEVDELPTQGVAKKIDAKLRRQAFDYICIYRLRGTAHDLWVVPVRTNEKRDLVMVEYIDANAEVIYQKIDGITLDFEQTNIVDLRSKVQGAFVVNSEKVTKDFYAGFKKQHKAFTEFITGIDDHIEVKNNRNKQWYASVILNRLMFCYFIQKKGFLAFDTDYLRKKLDYVRANEGEDKFYNFYRGFLRRLFQDGLNSPRHTRDFVDIYGQIPYLNGGMFDEHQLEAEYADIDIPDQAFIGLFEFFDKWEWHLDTRLTANGRDINPDVLGYIFEQYINDRAQMGAYYTKEDITEYIGRNCILPFLFDKVRAATADSRKAFAPDGFVWTSLRESGDRYIFDAVKHGYGDFGSIPPSIARGLITDEMRREYAETPIADLPDSHVPLSELRSEWNTRTPEKWGLPTEIWRETIDRLQRCGDILGKISRGEITSINDFITYNLDIRTFAADLLAKADNRFVGWFYRALQSVTILDPTCGSGAFLFAAMNILEPLYEICLDRMHEFHKENPALFKAELAEITDKYRSNIQYFIYKSIILRNLYGVDIMVEATEIAKLRLFLKMVAVVDVDRRAPNLGLDPLPDIDFNIRCGNTLVGYANKQQLDYDLCHAENILETLANQDFKQQIEEEMQKVARAYDDFKYIQLSQDESLENFKQAKSDLRKLHTSLNDKLNRRLYITSTGYNIADGEDFAQTKAYRDWLASHQPFHWLAEFYQIIEGNHGFDVIIGNPPYVEIRQIDSIYKLNNYQTLSCGNLYACIYERCMSLIDNNNSFIGFIVQLPIVCTDRMKEAQNLLLHGQSWILTFDDRPGKLFDDLTHIRATIFISKPSNINITHSSKYNRWYSINRNHLFQIVTPSKTFLVEGIEAIPKIGSFLQASLLKKISMNQKISVWLNMLGPESVYFHNAPQYFTRATTFQPYFWNEKDGKKLSVSVKAIPTTNAKVLNDILNSSIFYLWFITLSDCRHLNMREINNFPFSIKYLSEVNNKLLTILSDDLMTD